MSTKKSYSKKYYMIICVIKQDYYQHAATDLSVCYMPAAVFSLFTFFSSSSAIPLSIILQVNKTITSSRSNLELEIVHVRRAYGTYRFL